VMCRVEGQETLKPRKPKTPKLAYQTSVWKLVGAFTNAIAMAAMASVSSTARSLFSPLSVCSPFIESRYGNKRSSKRICPSSSGISVGVSAIDVVVVSATKKRQQSGTAATAATAYLRSYGRRAAMIVLSSAAPALLLLLQQVPIMHGLEFPKSVKDEYDEEEERLVQLFEVRGFSSYPEEWSSSRKLSICITCSIIDFSKGSLPLQSIHKMWRKDFFCLVVTLNE
jgi:hypothetical protein